MKANLQCLVKLNYRIVFSCFDYIRLWASNILILKHCYYQDLIITSFGF